MPAQARTSLLPALFASTFDVGAASAAGLVELVFHQERQVLGHAGLADHRFFTSMDRKKVVSFFERLGRVRASYRSASGEDWCGLIQLSLEDNTEALLVVRAFGDSPVTVAATLSTVKPEGSTLASRYLASLERRFPSPVSKKDDILLTFWALTAGGPEALLRPITPVAWSTVRANYPSSVEHLLGRILTEGPSSDTGRLLLLHGQPGTGKTFYVRALATEWRGKVSVEVITDPEAFFGTPQYMLDVLLRPARAHGGGKPPQWKLIVLEDTGELLADTARSETGQGLSRLLNLTAGLLGEGMKVLFLFSTNEPLGACHPAVIRPGRCRATVELKPFQVSEANAWLRGHGKDVELSSPATLAELFAILQGGPASTKEPKRRALGFSTPRVEPTRIAS